MTASIQYPPNFLQSLVDKGKSYNQINTACSALSVVISYGNPTFGKILTVKRFLKGVFEFLSFLLLQNSSNYKTAFSQTANYETYCSNIVIVRRTEVSDNTYYFTRFCKNNR